MHRQKALRVLSIAFVATGLSAISCGTNNNGAGAIIVQSSSGSGTGSSGGAGASGNPVGSGSTSGSTAGTGATSGNPTSGTTSASGVNASTGAESGVTSGASSGTPTGSGTTSESGTTAGSGTGATSGAGGTGATSGTAAGGTGATSGTAAGTGSTSGGASGASSGTGSSGTAACVPVAASCTGSGVPADLSVLQRGNDLLRRENFVEPLLTKAAAGTLALNTNFKATFNGSMHASVLYLEAGPAAAGCPTTGTAATTCKATARTAGNGLFFAATNGNVVYALDETSGAIVWQTNINPAGGGDGIRGTPVVDPGTRAIIVATGANGQHQIHSLSVDDGSERTGWPVILSTATLTVNPGTGNVPFNSGAQNEHGALLLANNIVYVPFGGEYGDGGNYNGWVVAINVTNPAQVSGWVSLGGQEGIWGHGGLASDGAGSIFAVTGNGHAGNHNANDTDSEEVVRLTGMASLTRNANNIFYPTIWQSMDGTDKDFGASTPAYTPLPAGSNPSAVLVAPAKPGHVYFLNGTNLSGGTYPNAGGELADIVVANTGGESVYTSPTIYTTTSGIHATIGVSEAPVCPAGSPASANGKMIISMLIQPGCTPFAKTVWCATAANSGGGNQYNEPPISTTTDGGCANALVWFNNGSGLTVVDGDTGVPLAQQPTGACAYGIEKMSWPVAVKNRIVVAGDGGLCSWSIGGM